MTTIVLAKIFGIFITVWGLGVMLNTASIKAMLTELEGHKLIHAILGMFLTIIGAYIISVHHVFTELETTLVSTLAYIFLVQGALQLMLPDVLISVRKSIIKRIPANTVGLIITIYGVMLLYFGFFA